MKITRSSKIQSLILATALSIGLGFVSPVSAQSAQDRSYILDSDGKGLTDLGTLGGKGTEAYGINDTGQVVGRSYVEGGPSHAFITGPNGMGMTDLGTLGGDHSRAYGINNAGQVAGVRNGRRSFARFHHRSQWRGHDRSRDAGWSLEFRLWHQ